MLSVLSLSLPLAMANIQQVSDGLRKQLIQEGSQIRPSAGDTITVECTGNIGDGTGQGKMVKKFWRLVQEGLHGWCGRGCMAGVGRGFMQVWVGLYGITGTVNYMIYSDTIKI